MSYSGDPSNSDLDLVRFLSGDSDIDEEYASDAEVNYCISSSGSANGAAVMVCDHIAAKFAREVDIKVGADGEFQIKMSQLSKQFTDRANELRKRSALSASPWAASISISEKEDQEDRTDRVKPAFARDQFKDDGSASGLSPEWNDSGYR